MNKSLWGKIAGAKGAALTSALTVALTAFTLFVVCKEDKPVGPPGGDGTGNETKFTLTTSVSAGNGFIELSPTSADGKYEKGTDVTATAKPASGYKFDGWAGVASGTLNPTTFKMPANNTTLAATFSLIGTGGGNTYTLTININPPGGGTVTPQSGSTYPQATSVELTASPAANYDFDGWTGAINNPGNPASLTMTSDRTVTANFKPKSGGGTDACVTSPGQPACCGSNGSNPNHPSCQGGTTTYLLTIASLPANGGTVTLDPPGGSYTAGTQVTATAQENSGFTFSYWTGASSVSASSVTIVMPASNTSLTANFQASGGSFTITTSTNPSNGGTITLTPLKASYSNGDAVTATANAYTGYTFVGWSGADNSTTSPVLIIMDGNKSLTANFQVSTTDQCVLNPGSAACCAQTPTYPGCGGGGTGKKCFWAASASNNFTAACVDIGGQWCDPGKTCSEAECTAGYGTVITDCSNPPVTEYCWWGPVLADGTGGCHPITTPTQRADCQSFGAINTDPNCPNQTIGGGGGGGGGTTGACVDASNRPLFCHYKPYQTSLGGCYALDPQYATPAGQTCAALQASCTAASGDLYHSVPSTALNTSNNYGDGVNCGTAGGTLVSSGGGGGGGGGSCGTGDFCLWEPNEFNNNQGYCGLVDGLPATDANCCQAFGKMVASCAGSGLQTTGPQCYWEANEYNQFKSYCGKVDGGNATAANCTNAYGVIVQCCKDGLTPCN